MHDALQMSEDGHARVFLHALHQALAAARHDHVHIAAEALEHLAHRRPVAGGDQRDRCVGQASGAQTLHKAGVDDARGMETVGAAAQDGGVARLEAERARIRRHIGAAFVDDADDAQRGRHALDPEAIGPLVGGQHPPHGIGQGCDVFQPLGHGLDPGFGQQETVKIGLAGVGGGSRLHVAGVGLQHILHRGAQQARRRHERGVLALARGERQLPCGAARLAAQLQHALRHVALLAAAFDHPELVHHGPEPVLFTCPTLPHPGRRVTEPS